MKDIITYIERAGIFHLSVLFYQYIIGFLRFPEIATAIMALGWTSAGHMVFYIYSSNLIVKSLKIRPSELTLERSLYNLTELYSIYIWCFLIHIISHLISFYWLAFIINSISNAVFIGHLYLQIHGYSDAPFVSIIMTRSNLILLLGLGVFIESGANTNKELYNLYILPVLNYISIKILLIRPLEINLTPKPPLIRGGYVEFIWTYILNNVDVKL